MRAASPSAASQSVWATGTLFLRAPNISSLLIGRLSVIRSHNLHHCHLQTAMDFKLFSFRYQALLQMLLSVCFTAKHLASGMRLLHSCRWVRPQVQIMECWQWRGKGLCSAYKSKANSLWMSVWPLFLIVAATRELRRLRTYKLLLRSEKLSASVSQWKVVNAGNDVSWSWRSCGSNKLSSFW